MAQVNYEQQASKRKRMQTTTIKVPRSMGERLATLPPIPATPSLEWAAQRVNRLQNSPGWSLTVPGNEANGTPAGDEARAPSAPPAGEGQSSQPQETPRGFSQRPDSSRFERQVPQVPLGVRGYGGMSTQQVQQAQQAASNRVDAINQGQGPAASMVQAVNQAVRPAPTDQRTSRFLPPSFNLPNTPGMPQTRDR